LNPVELFRAKNKIYNQLSDVSNTSNLASSIAEQVTYLGRRVPRSEYAKRVAHYDTGLLNRAATRWFWDRELSVVAWGPCHSIINFSHYNRPIKRSTLGWYGN
jgi:processing peptidase subunit beta